jgi:hypothetical protein
VLCAAAKACADDIHKFCNVTWFAGLSPGSVLACLKEARTTLKPACQKEVFKLQLDAAEDYRWALYSLLCDRGKQQPFLLHLTWSVKNMPRQQVETAQVLEDTAQTDHSQEWHQLVRALLAAWFSQRPR